MATDDYNTNISELVAAWFAGDHAMFDACTEMPELAWKAILEISSHGLNDEDRSLLAAGPLETLLAWHGTKFIARVICEAQRNPQFRDLLNGIWRHDMPDEVWNQIEKARDANSD